MLLQLLLPSIHFLWMEREESVMNIKKVAISFLNLIKQAFRIDYIIKCCLFE